MTGEKGKNLLLVEDEAITAKVQKKELENYGYSVQNVSNGEDAVEKALDATANIDLILMDIELGAGIDGTEAARKILKKIG